VVGSVLQAEREAFCRVRREGMEKARDRGVAIGRPAKPRPENFSEVLAMWKAGEISRNKAAKALGVNPLTFDKWRKEACEEIELSLCSKKVDFFRPPASIRQSTELSTANQRSAHYFLKGIFSQISIFDAFDVGKHFLYPQTKLIAAFSTTEHRRAVRSRCSCRAACI